MLEFEHPNHGTQRPTYFFELDHDHDDAVSQMRAHLDSDEIFLSAQGKKLRAPTVPRELRQHIGKKI